MDQVTFIPPPSFSASIMDTYKDKLRSAAEPSKLSLPGSDSNPGSTEDGTVGVAKSRPARILAFNCPPWFPFCSRPAPPPSLPTPRALLPPLQPTRRPPPPRKRPPPPKKVPPRTPIIKPPPPPKSPSSLPPVAPSKGRRGLWNSIGKTPSTADIMAAPAHYSVVIINPWETAALRKLKQLDPSIIVLMYKCLSSVRSYDTSSNPPAGVTYAAAQANPAWFAVDLSGNRIQWNTYPGHWQTAVWDPSYQQAWARNVVAVVTADPWDGVFADNDMWTLKWYSSALFSGTPSADETDAKLRAGLQGLIDTAGAALVAKGKILVPNISDGRLLPGRWAAHSKYGGGFDEQFVHFTSGQAVTDWGPTGWVDQTAEMSGPGIALAVTGTAPGDVAGQLYGYASLLVRGDDDAFWMPGSGDNSYASPQSIPELKWRTGSALGPGTKLGNGAWTRSFTGVWAAVNPTTATVTVQAPSGARNVAGNVVTAVTLGSSNGVVLRLV